MRLQVGDTRGFTRTFSDADILAFADLSGDRGRHHVARDPSGRLMAQGLLTATLPTKIGGDLNYVAREMEFVFLAPVWSGDTVRCMTVVEEARHGTGRTWYTLRIVCTNQDGVEVLRGRTVGFIAG